MFEDWDPFKRMKKFQEEMEKAFERSFGKSMEHRGFGKEFAGFREPLSDVVEEDDEVVVNVELLGIDKKDIVLEVTGDMIKVRAEKKEKEIVQKKGFFKQERSYKGFYRAIPLPSEVRADEAEAEYKEGVLRIRIPKGKKKKVKKIIVK